MYTITPLTTELLVTHFDSYFATLATLSPVGEHTIQTATECFANMSQQGTIVFVAIDELQWVVGTCSVLIEQKLNRGWSFVAHLEDLAVHPSTQGQWIGKALIQTAIDYARLQKCYKIILDADKDPAHVHYYEKFWFTNEWAYMKISF